MIASSVSVSDKSWLPELMSKDFAMIDHKSIFVWAGLGSPGVNWAGVDWASFNVFLFF